MAKMTWLERRYRRSRLDYVRHITIDPRGPGVVRIHMIPPRTEDPSPWANTPGGCPPPTGWT